MLSHTEMDNWPCQWPEANLSGSVSMYVIESGDKDTAVPGPVLLLTETSSLAGSKMHCQSFTLLNSTVILHDWHPSTQGNLK